MTTPLSLLDATMAPLRAGHAWRELVAGEPAGAGWVALADVVADQTLLRGWFDEFLAGTTKGKADVAGAYLAAYLSGIIAEPVVDAVVSVHRAWPVTAANLAVRRHELGWFDGLAVLGPEVQVLTDDAAAEEPHAVVVATVDDLRDQVAGQIAAVLDPIFATIRGMAPFGLRGMWGSVADGLAGGVLWSARSAGHDDLDAWQAVTHVTDRLASHVPALRTRPDIERIDWTGGVLHVPVKGTCCLYYKVFDGVPDPRGEGYCLSCPRRDTDDRRERWARYLDDEQNA